MDLANFTDVLGDADEIGNSQPLSQSLSRVSANHTETINTFQGPIGTCSRIERPPRRTGQQGEFRSVEEIDEKYRDVFTYQYFNLVQSSVIDDALYTDKSMVVCAPTGSGKTVIFEMAIVKLLMDLDSKKYTGDFKIIYMAPVKALCTERLSEWYPKFTKLGLMCIEVTGDTAVDFSQLKPYRIIITTPEKWDMLTRRWRDHKSLVEVIKLFLIDEVHILNDNTRGPVLEAVVSRMKTIEASSQSAYRIEQLQKQYQSKQDTQHSEIANNNSLPVRIRFVAVSATISNPEDVAAWLGASDKPAVFYKFGDECRPVKLKRVVEGYPCSEGTSIFKFDIILNYKLWPIIQKYHDGKPTLIFCNTRKSVAMTAETLSRELTVRFTPEQQERLSALASSIKNKKLQALVLSGVGCHHAGLLYEERINIEKAFRNRDLPILITTTTLAMGVNLPAHLVIIKNTQQYVNGAYQEYSISTVLQMVGRAGRPQFDTEATAVIMTRLQDKSRYQALVGGDEPLQSYLHKRLAENLNSEAALGTVCDVAQCVQWLRSTFLYVRAAKDPKRYLGLPPNAQQALILKKIEELCVKAMNGLATAGLITMDEASCIESTEAGRLMSVFYLDLETMKHIMKIEGTESLEQLLWIVCECHELADMHLRVDERRTLNTLNRNNAAATIRLPMKGKINTRQMKLSCVIQAVLGCLPIPDPSLNQEAMKIMKIADRVCKCLVAYVTRPDLISTQPQYFTAVVNALTLAKCVEAHLWENSPYVSKQLKGIGPTFSSLLATAGKINFTLLEESHPRDLERIMNKGAPAGNVIRKQISLLPKYQLTTTPIDEKRITIQLLLLNQHHLAENREQLTAGESHKCYIVVGDSENYLLLLTSFKDKDLISIYDGTLTCQVTRKHNYEHKILIHCISSNWVGIDVQCDYLFKNIEPAFLRGESIIPISTHDHDTLIKTSKKQINVTDMYKERKRKNNETDITESKEKKKRDTALIEKFKLLKNSFEITSKELKEDLDKSAKISNMIINEMIQPDKYERKKIIVNQPPHMLESINNNILHLTEKKNVDINDSESKYDYSKLESLDDEENLVVDDHINTIMNKIETEIFKSNNEAPTCEVMNVKTQMTQQTKTNVQSASFKPLPISTYDNARPSVSGISPIPSADIYLSKSKNEKKKRKPNNVKTNYSFNDAIDKNVETDNFDVISQKSSGFSDTIKSQIEKFLQRTVKTKQDDITILGLLDNVEYTEKLYPQKNCTQSTNTTKSDIISGTKSMLLSSEQPAVNVDLNKATNYDMKFTLKKNNSVHKHINETDERSKDISIHKNVQNTDTTVEHIEREYNISSQESSNIHVKHDIINATNYIKNHDHNTSERVKDKNEKNNITVRRYHQENILNSNGTRAQNGDYLAGKEEVEENHEDLKEMNSQSYIDNGLAPVKENTTCDKNVDYLYKSLCHISIPFVDGEKTKLHINKDLYDESLSPKLLHTMSQYRPSSTHNEPKLPDNFKTISKSVTASEDRNQNRTTNILPTKAESRPQITNNSDFSHNNIAFHRTCENSAGNEETDDYINRYLFTATKIDVCMKNMSDHQIQIIRKLKLDVDVTEVVSKGNKSKVTKTSEKSQQVEEQHNQADSKQNLKNGECHLDSDRGLVNILQDFAIKEIASVENEENKQCALPESHTSNAEEQNTHRYNKAIRDVNKNILPQAEETNVPKITKEGESKSEDLEQYKKYLLEIATANAVSTTEESFNTILTETEGKDKYISLTTENNDIKYKQQYVETNKIENILQKYSVILRKSNKVLNNNTTNKNTMNHNITWQRNKQTKKPYKISDIQKLHNIPLPKNLIAVEASRTSRPANDDNDVLKRKIEMKQATEINSPREKEENKEMVNTSSIIAYNIEDNLSEDIPDYHSSATDISQVELTEAFDLDQSMFNPKTLLEQCFSKNENYYGDDEIIPPPSEFCDNETVYSPVTILEEDLVDFTSLNNYVSEESLTTHDQSIFEDDNSVLTPSVEIETWTLSHDDNKTNYFKSQSHTPYTPPPTRNTEKYVDDQSKYNLKSFTVMRRNSSIRNRSKKLDLSSKLGHYKYTHKDKM